MKPILQAKKKTEAQGRHGKIASKMDQPVCGPGPNQ